METQDTLRLSGLQIKPTTHPFKFSGRIAPGSLLHSIREEAPEGSLIPPTYVSTPWGTVPQYAPTASSQVDGFNPSGDCGGNFMSYKYQPNNNCYAYGCCISSNSFPQPGRFSGGTPFNQEFTGEVVMNNAVKDGLVYIGTARSDMQAHAASGLYAGHYVALLFSAPESNIGGDPNANWPGDYHWVRCDDLNSYTWSQKDGGDQVTNFDFAGNPITDPTTANWTVNQGPIGQVGSTTDNNEYTAAYDFFCFMFVPATGVNII
ncbi:MAG TPA: hypothetical protein VFZ47_04325 [Chitinophagaceae bacterium]